MKWEDRRRLMVEKHLFKRGISNENILKAFLKIERHTFIPESMRNFHSYEDCALSIGENQTISQPYIVAFMLQSLDINKQHDVLEIGTGSGYQTAILSLLCKRVFTVERINSLYVHAKKLLEANYENIYFRLGDGTKGWEKAYPIVKQFDRIIVSAGAPDDIPKALINQLKPNGKLIIPSGKLNLQKLKFIVKDENNNISTKQLGSCTFVPLIGKEGWK